MKKYPTKAYDSYYLGPDSVNCRMNMIIDCIAELQEMAICNPNGDVVKDEKQYTISDLRLKLMELNKIRRDNHAEHMNNAADYFLDWLEEKK